MTTSTKPYLLRAIYEWCVDQGFTPHIAVVVDEHTIVPPAYVRDGQIVLNLSPDATGQLMMGNELITFQARFGGAAHALSIPVANVVAIYARENGHGMAFEPEAVAGGEGGAEPDEARQEEAPSPDGTPDDDERPTPPGRGGGGHLKVVK